MALVARGVEDRIIVCVCAVFWFYQLGGADVRIADQCSWTLVLGRRVRHARKMRFFALVRTQQGLPRLTPWVPR